MLNDELLHDSEDEEAASFLLFALVTAGLGVGAIFFGLMVMPINP